MKSYIKQSIFAVAALGLFAACSSDTNEPALENDEVTEGIELAIPSHYFSTRTEVTDADFTDDEAKINTLWVIAYNTEEPTKKYARNLSGIIKDSAVSDYKNPEYKAVPCRLPAGKYHIYLLANIDPTTIGTITDEVPSFDESTLQNAQLSNLAMIQDDDLKGTTRTYLPMSTYYTKLRKEQKAATEFENGVVVIKSAQKTTVYADLIFAVSKVRISIYNTKTKNLTLQTNGVTLGKLSDTETAFNTQTLKEGGNQISGIPSGEYYGLASDWSDPNSWSGVNVNEHEAKLGNVSTANIWMWQSIVYIPERLYKETDPTPSTISVKFSNGSGKDDQNLTGTVTDGKNKGFERGKLYDIIGYVDAKVVNLYVRVKPWQYVKYTYDLEDDDSGSVTPAI